MVQIIQQRSNRHPFIVGEIDLANDNLQNSSSEISVRTTDAVMYSQENNSGEALNSYVKEKKGGILLYLVEVCYTGDPTSILIES